ncbi:glycosyltransferase family 1 protein [Sphaerobolus stellatus SS14]|uniref:Glycosyltransferase family 1 protein n=1 Tax=Sphaerobolus stellatus (strain SS14) TaxID=990650 RepID=A0A0C9UJ73_SPHS4|nr:glycosyltransferase family 1 protein [Sphaerobolus stellatus SS14]
MAITGHIVLVCIPGWGHLRALVVFACKVIQQRPNIGVTILTAGNIIQKVETEISRHFAADDDAKDNIRVLSVLEQNANVFHLISNTAEASMRFYESIYRQEQTTCLVSGMTFPPWISPKLVIINIFLDIVQIARTINPTATVLGWAPTNNSSMIRQYGPEELGGAGVISVKAIVEAERTGKPVKQIENELSRPENGDVIQIPGLPPMYDYEFIPQQKIPVLEDANTAFAKASQHFIRQADGIITPGTSAFEAEALAAVKKWQSENRKEMYIVGPLVPIEDGSGNKLKKLAQENESAASDKGSEIEEFLEKILHEYGAYAMIYIAFGSSWWPDSKQIWTFVNVLIEQKVPFILARPSPMAAVPDAIAAKVQESGIGLFSTWTPQQLILAHKATGWFLSHCGQNSVVESMAEGVPMIAWPILGDQPDNAALLSLKLNVAYQLTEARTGEAGLKALKRGVQPTGTIQAVEREAREVLEKARSVDGEIKRKNAHAIKDRMKEAWEENGEALTELRRLLEKEFPSK